MIQLGRKFKHLSDYMSSLEPTLSKILNLGKLRHPASEYLGGHQKQKFSPCFRFGARKNLLNMDVKILFLVFCPQGLGQMAELEFGLGQSKTVMCGNGFGLASAD